MACENPVMSLYDVLHEVVRNAGWNKWLNLGVYGVCIYYTFIIKYIQLYIYIYYKYIYIYYIYIYFMSCLYLTRSIHQREAPPCSHTPSCCMERTFSHPNSFRSWSWLWPTVTVAAIETGFIAGWWLWNIHPKWLYCIFFRGVETTNHKGMVKNYGSYRFKF